MSTSQAFTAAQIAVALGRRRQAVTRDLGDIPPDDVQIARGFPAKAWLLRTLPAKWQRKLRAQARRQGYPSPGELLAACAQPWQPRLPLAQIAEPHIAKAHKLRAALAGTLQRLNDEAISASEFLSRGLADYRAALGHAISERHWRRLLDRTVTRDRAREDWQRLEIYVDDKCAARGVAITSATVNARSAFPSIAALLKSMPDPVQPSETEMLSLWVTVFDTLGDMEAAGTARKKTRLALLRFLASTPPFQARSRNALEKAFDYKLAAWEKGGRVPSALHDQRAIANREKRTPPPAEDDRQKLLAYGTKFGSLKLGTRKALQNEALSPELTARLLDQSPRNMELPRSWLPQLQNDLRLLDDLEHGPRRAKLNGPFIERDPTTICSGEWMQGDDCTLPNLYYEEMPNGPRLMRGQLLAMLDVRSLYILGWVLISAPPDRPSTYNAWHIRNLITVVHDTYGLPRKGFYFENGTWRAQVLTGNVRDWNESEQGLREFGLRFVHAQLPRAKVIERVLGALQNLTQAEPGYVGRGWHNDRYERTEKQKSLVERGHVPAARHFLSRDEWMDRIGELVNQYNDEPQYGKHCAGLSPRAAYERHFGNKDDVVRLDDDARHLLANERFMLKVGRNGVVIDRRRARGATFTYKNELTGELWNRSVEVFFNLESPEIIGVKHPDTGLISAVRRATTADVMDAEPEQLAQAHRENAAHSSYRRALYRAVQPKFTEHFMRRPIFRPTLLDRETAEAGEHFRETAALERAAEKAEKRVRGKAVAAAERIGMPITGAITEDRAQAAQELASLLEETDAPLAP